MVDIASGSRTYLAPDAMSSVGRSMVASPDTNVIGLVALGLIAITSSGEYKSLVQNCRVHICIILGICYLYVYTFSKESFHVITLENMISERTRIGFCSPFGEAVCRMECCLVGIVDEGAWMLNGVHYERKTFVQVIFAICPRIRCSVCRISSYIFDAAIGNGISRTARFESCTFLSCKESAGTEVRLFAPPLVHNAGGIVDESLICHTCFEYTAGTKIAVHDRNAIDGYIVDAGSEPDVP